MADGKMKRGIQQSLYKYLPGSWADFSKSGGGLTYAVQVKEWNSIQLTGINSKRLLRVVNNRVKEFIAQSDMGTEAVVDFATDINEETYDVLTPKVSDTISAINTVVKPLVFVCNKCGRARQFSSYEEFKRREHEPCDKCHSHMTQVRMIRYCKCGYADGIYVPKCTTEGHGTKYMTRRGSGMDFVCSKCGKKAYVSPVCPECNAQLYVKSALDSSNYLPATITLIDLLDKRKDTFLENETEAKGEKVVLAQYLDLIPQEQYETIVEKGRIEQVDEFEDQLQKHADMLRSGGLTDENIIATVLDSMRRANPNGLVYNAIAKVSNTLAVGSNNELTPIAEEILEYDELVHAKTTLSLDEAERDSAIINDGLQMDYRKRQSHFRK